VEKQGWWSHKESSVRQASPQQLLVTFLPSLLLLSCQSNTSLPLLFCLIVSTIVNRLNAPWSSGGSLPPLIVMTSRLLTTTATCRTPLPWTSSSVVSRPMRWRTLGISASMTSSWLTRRLCIKSWCTSLSHHSSGSFSSAGPSTPWRILRNTIPSSRPQSDTPRPSVRWFWMRWPQLTRRYTLNKLEVLIPANQCVVD